VRNPWEQIAEVPARDGLVEVDDGLGDHASQLPRPPRRPDVSDLTAAREVRRTPILWVNRRDRWTSWRSDRQARLTWGSRRSVRVA
jgi:hypothetical protein